MTLIEDLAGVLALREKAKNQPSVPDPYIGIAPQEPFSGELPASAQYVIAACSFISTHAAEIQAMARDAERYRWLRDSDNETLCVRAQAPLHVGRWDYLRVLGATLDKVMDAALASREGLDTGNE